MLSARRFGLPVLIATAIGLVAGTGCSRERVPLPAPDATPQEVVATYLKALNAADCANMRALSDPENSVASWCGNITVTNIVTGEPFPDTCCGPGQEHAQVINVPVEFRTRGGDVSMPDGEHVWGYILVRDDDTQRWRVASQGAG